MCYITCNILFICSIQIFLFYGSEFSDFISKISKLKWMNLGYKQKYASRLADLLAFRKVVLFPNYVLAFL